MGGDEGEALRLALGLWRGRGWVSSCGGGPGVPGFGSVLASGAVELGGEGGERGVGAGGCGGRKRIASERWDEAGRASEMSMQDDGRRIEHECHTRGQGRCDGRCLCLSHHEEGRWCGEINDLYSAAQKGAGGVYVPGRRHAAGQGREEKPQGGNDRSRWGDHRARDSECPPRAKKAGGRMDGTNGDKEGRQGAESATGPANGTKSVGEKESRRACKAQRGIVDRRWMAGRALGRACGWQWMSSLGPDSKTGLQFGRGRRRRSTRVGNYCALDQLPSRSLSFEDRARGVRDPPNGGSNLGLPTRCPLCFTGAMVGKVSPRDKLRSITARILPTSASTNQCLRRQSCVSCREASIADTKRTVRDRDKTRIRRCDPRTDRG